MSESDFRTDDARAEADASTEQDASVTGADAGPIDEADMAAAEGLEVSEGVAEHYQEMTQRGANQQGEGAIP